MVLNNLVCCSSFHGNIGFISRSYYIDKKNIHFCRQQGYNLNTLSECGNTISDNRIAFISLNVIHPEIRCLFRGNCLASLCCHCRRKLQAVKICLDKRTAWKLLVKLNNREQSNFWDIQIKRLVVELKENMVVSRETAVYVSCGLIFRLISYNTVTCLWKK